MKPSSVICFDDFCRQGSPPALLDAGNVAINRPAVDAGLTILNAGGDFADDVIAYEGSWRGADVFVSFDESAVLLIAKQGQQARLLA